MERGGSRRGGEKSKSLGSFMGKGKPDSLNKLLRRGGSRDTEGPVDRKDKEE